MNQSDRNRNSFLCLTLEPEACIGDGGDDDGGGNDVDISDGVGGGDDGDGGDNGESDEYGAQRDKGARDGCVVWAARVMM